MCLLKDKWLLYFSVKFYTFNSLLGIFTGNYNALIIFLAKSLSCTHHVLEVISYLNLVGTLMKSDIHMMGSL